MSRYWGITESSSAQDSVITPGDQGDAEAVTFRSQSKTEKSYNVRGGSSGSSAASEDRNSTGEY